jgi:flagellar assembly factor FliW
MGSDKAAVVERPDQASPGLGGAVGAAAHPVSTGGPAEPRYDATARGRTVATPAEQRIDASTASTSTDGADSDDKVIEFPDGILGFPGNTRFVLINDSDDAVFQLLQSLEDPEVALIVSVPWLFFPDYAPEISDLERKQIGLEAPEDAIVFCPVTLSTEPDTVFVNLLGPFVVNRKTLEGRQVVLADSDYPVRAMVKLSAA